METVENVGTDESEMSRTPSTEPYMYAVLLDRSEMGPQVDLLLDSSC